MAFEDLLSDIDAQTQRVVGSKTVIDVRKELSDNLYPMLAMIVEAVDKRITVSEDAIANVIDQEDSFLLPELSEQILTVFAQASTLASAIIQQLTPEQKELRDQAAQLLSLIMPATEEVVSVTVEEDEDEEGDEEEEEREAQ